VITADACTIETHETIKSDVVKWANDATPITDAPVFGMEWKNCNACSSTLARPVEVRS
jgi:hypothetical protein